MTRILLSFACALALILIPLSYSPVWAQETSPSSTQQDRVDRNDANQNQTQTSPDLNQDQSNASSTDTNSSGMRQKPSSSSESNTSATQDPNRPQNQNRTDTQRSQTTTQSQSRSESQTTGPQATDQNVRGNRNLPKTAGELPLLALIGLLSLSAAAGTRVLARARSTR